MAKVARRLLSDNDADAAKKISQGRNLAVHMYRGQLGSEIAERLAGHAAVLHRWLDALRQRADEGD